MKNLTKITLALTLTGTMLGGVAFAAQHKEDGEKKPRAERMFEQLDKDADGKATLDEMKAAAAERFSKRDIDGDGIISRDDRKAFRTAQREERRTEIFATMDADGDGMISLDEFKSAEPPRREARGERRGTRGGEMRGERHGGKGMRGHRMGRHEGHRMRGKAQGGKRRGGMRGVLTIQEAEARATQRFERIDSDNKGYITLNDIKAAHADKRGNRR